MGICCCLLGPQTNRKTALIRPVLGLAVPAMFFQFGEQGGIEGAGVTGGDVLANVFRAAHADDCRAHCGMRQDEAQGHFRKRQAGGDDFLELVNALNCVREIFWAEISRAPIVFGETGFEGHLAAETAFVERDARDHADVEFLAEREKFVLGRLIEDVVDHLHGVD